MWYNLAEMLAGRLWTYDLAISISGCLFCGSLLLPLLGTFHYRFFSCIAHSIWISLLLSLVRQSEIPPLMLHFFYAFQLSERNCGHVALWTSIEVILIWSRSTIILPHRNSKLDLITVNSFWSFSFQRNIFCLCLLILNVLCKSFIIIIHLPLYQLFYTVIKSSMQFRFHLCMVLKRFTSLKFHPII